MLSGGAMAAIAISGVLVILILILVVVIVGAVLRRSKRPSG